MKNSTLETDYKTLLKHGEERGGRDCSVVVEADCLDLDVRGSARRLSVKSERTRVNSRDENKEELNVSNQDKQGTNPF